MVAALDSGFQDAYRAFEASHNGVRVVPLQGVASTEKKLGQLLRNSGQHNRLRQLLMTAYRRSGAAAPAAETKRAMAAIDGHTIVVVRGTDQLRAYNYRLHFPGEPVHDLHHIIPLQLGGGHEATRLVDMPPDLHRELHRIIGKVQFDETTSLAPNSIRQSGTLDFAHGAAALLDGGTVQLARLNPDGTYSVLP